MKTGILDTRLLEQNISKRIQCDVDAHRISGAAVAVMQRGQLLYRNTFGYQNPEGQEPLRPDAIFRIASMTKPVTTVALLIQAQRGKLKLEDPVAKYIPEFAQIPMTYGGYNAVPLQIWHLLTHTGSMETDAASRETARYQMPKEMNKTLVDAMGYYATLPLPYEPGTHRRYSGRVGFDILGRIVEVTSGMDLETFFQQEIFIPCDMVDTTFVPSPAQWERVVGLHNLVDGRSVTVPTNPGCVVDDVPVTHFLGGSGLISTLDDYRKFAQMLLNKGMTPKGRILDAAWVEKMATAQLPVEMMTPEVNQGLGVRVITGDGYPWLPDGTFGWSGAHGTHYWVDPANEIVAVYLKNSRYDTGSGSITGKHFEEDIFRSLL